MTELKKGKYLFKQGRINRVDLHIFNQYLFEILIFIAFIMSFTLELLLFYSYSLKIIPNYESLLFLFNVLFLIVIYSIIFGIVASFLLEMKYPEKKDRLSIKLLLLALIFFNLIFVISVIKDLSPQSFTLMDHLLYFTIFTSGVFIIGIVILKNIFKTIKMADIHPSKLNLFVLKLSSASIGVVVICSIILLVDTSIIALSGTVTFEGKTIADIWHWEDFALTMAIIGAGIGIAGVIVWKRRDIFGGGGY